MCECQTESSPFTIPPLSCLCFVLFDILELWKHVYVNDSDCIQNASKTPDCTVHKLLAVCAQSETLHRGQRETTPDGPTKYNSASVPSVVFRRTILCFLLILPSRLATQCFPCEVADILPSSLFDKQKRFKYLFHLLNMHTSEVIMTLEEQDMRSSNDKIKKESRL